VNQPYFFLFSAFRVQWLPASTTNALAEQQSALPLFSGILPLCSCHGVGKLPEPDLSLVSACAITVPVSWEQDWCGPCRDPAPAFSLPL